MVKKLVNKVSETEKIEKDKIEKPAKAYLRRAQATEKLQLRIDVFLKLKAETEAKKLNTSINRLTEAALKWYLDELEKTANLDAAIDSILDTKKG